MQTVPEPEVVRPVSPAIVNTAPLSVVCGPAVQLRHLDRAGLPHVRERAGDGRSEAALRLLIVLVARCTTRVVVEFVQDGVPVMAQLVFAASVTENAVPDGNADRAVARAATS